MNPIRVFLVDDHPLAREGIRRLLGSETGIEVVGEAGSAEEAVEKVDGQCVDVVLMDIKLRDIDGIEATRRLVAQNAELKVVVLSSFSGAYLTQAIEAGATGYIMKTVTQPELVRAVVQAAGGQSPLDPNLTANLFGRVAELSRMARSLVLSSRQRELLRLIADGVPSKEIEATLSMSHATMSRELRRVFDLLGVDNRAHAVDEAHRRDLL